ncbi:MAG: GntR family transcriptional regulator [Rhodoplanes sp.]|uniref:GntR family transcriptional regulator n=1 Tax=Rhodoplanes sp. TaxID=1968906 RepID=UPI0018203386|nr:GntR family transcriptional regulator [Rhodoplanes sp.]NVO14394.1 GntR family transcriptional regulator [Rhodoplanes sp.]
MGRGQDRAYETLRQRLVGGHYQPGTQLREEPLAREFGLSRTPVRAALKRLVEDGLATADAGQGIHVAEWSEHDIEETFQLRMLLEPHAARLAAERGGDALLESLRASNRQIASALAKGGADAIVKIQEANRTFHHVLLDHARSPRLRAILDTMIDMPVIIRAFYLFTRDELEQSLHHHQDLTIAVEARDGELARQVMQLHLRMSYRRFMQHRSEWRRTT